MSFCLLSLSMLFLQACSKETPASFHFQPLEASEKAIMMQEVNTLRKQDRNCGSAGFFKAAPALSWDDELEQAAFRHATDMDRNDFFEHRGSDGSMVGKRTTESGYEWSVVGENIAVGYDAPGEVIMAWLLSPGHCKIMMEKAYTQMGAAKVGGYWVMVTASPL